MSSRSQPFLICGIAALAFVGIAHSALFATDIRYWAWQRSDPLEPDEIKALNGQHVTTIYWQIGELENTASTWRWKARFNFPGSDSNGIHFIPVLRLVSHEAQPFSEPSIRELLARLAAAARGQNELQIDYDAPDRLIADYAKALEQIRTLVPKLTITALPRWSRPAFLNVLAPNVDEFLPMLYDYEAEPVLRNELQTPLINPPEIAKLIDRWHESSKPWRAGLPVFARLSVYDANQKLRGQIRNWNWDELCFNRRLQTLSAGRFATFVLEAKEGTTIANTPIKTGEKVVVREVDRGALHNAIDLATQAGAQSIVFFRLPDTSASSGWSLGQIAHLDALPRLALHYLADEQAFELSNKGDADLAPRFPKPGESSGGYSVEVEAAPAIFREAHPGDFAGLTSYADEKPVSVPFATRLQFKFAQLRAGQALKSGLIQLAPGADFRQARYRILNMEGGSPWKNFE